MGLFHSFIHVYHILSRDSPEVPQLNQSINFLYIFAETNFSFAFLQQGQKLEKKNK